MVVQVKKTFYRISILDSYAAKLHDSIPNSFIKKIYMYIVSKIIMYFL